MWNTQRRSRDADRLLLYGYTYLNHVAIAFFFSVFVCTHTQTWFHWSLWKGEKKKKKMKKKKRKRLNETYYIAVSLLVPTIYIILFHYLLLASIVNCFLFFFYLSLALLLLSFLFFFVFSISSLGHRSTEASNSRFVCRCLKPVVFTSSILLFSLSLSLSLTHTHFNLKKKKKLNQCRLLLHIYPRRSWLIRVITITRSKTLHEVFDTIVYTYMYRELFAFIDTPSSDRWWYIYPATSSNLFGFMLFLFACLYRRPQLFVLGVNTGFITRHGGCIQWPDHDDHVIDTRGSVNGTTVLQAFLPFGIVQQI